MTANIAAIAGLLTATQRQLMGVSATPRLDAEVLLTHALDETRSYLYTWPDKRLTSRQLLKFETLLKRRLRGEPVAYITGQREFWSLELHVTPATLIPRPETERLVELALQRIPVDTSVRVADLGTGSGAIALALARERPLANVIATDNNLAALAVAAGNAKRLGVTVEFRQGDWCAALDAEQFFLIASNPPYVAATDPHLRRRDLRFEPVSALAAGDDGLNAIRTIVHHAMGNLEPGGWLLLEHGYDQGAEVVKLLRDTGYEAVTIERDWESRERVACARRSDDRLAAR